MSSIIDLDDKYDGGGDDDDDDDDLMCSICMMKLRGQALCVDD